MRTSKGPPSPSWLLLNDPNCKSYKNRLRAYFRDWKIRIEPDPHQATDFFFHHDVGLVLLGHSDEAPCFDLLNFFKAVRPSTPVIVLADFGSEELVVSVFRNGAWDYFKKPVAMKELKRSIQLALNARNEGDPRTPREGIFKAVRYITENFATHLRLSQIAQESAMSLSCFARTFKKEMGTTYTKFLNKFRISRAARMLEEDQLSISEIAFACGFNNPYHFSRMFKKIMQISPRDYRKSFKG